MSIRLTELVSRLAERGTVVSEVTAPGGREAVVDPLISDVEHDSRRVSPGSLFACIPSRKSNSNFLFFNSFKN